MPTVLAQPEELAGEEIEVRDDAYRHLFRSLRLAVGATLRVVDGVGGARAGTVAAVDRSRGRIALGDTIETLEPALRLELLCAAARPQRLRWMVEKATELGVASIRFLSTRRGVREVSPDQLEAFRRVAEAALIQCGRATLPTLSGGHEWTEVPDLVAGIEARAVLDLDPAAPTLAARLTTWPTAGRAVLLIGPEGGWSAEERADLIALACPVAGLGQRALRVETAAVAAASLCLLR